MTQDSGPGTQAAIMKRLRADREWLADQGIQLSQWGSDPISGRVRVYLAYYNEDARQVLVDRYGQDIVVDTQSRRWGVT